MRVRELCELIDFMNVCVCVCQTRACHDTDLQL